MAEIQSSQLRIASCIDGHLHRDDTTTPRIMNGIVKLLELLIIDEAEGLTPTALDLLRDKHDRTQLGIILIGVPGIDQRFRHYPQLYSRLGFSHRYRTLGRDELLFVLDRHWKRIGRSLDPDDFTDAQAIAAIERITRGNFRLLERLFPQITRVLKINQLETITDDVIEAAAITLVIGNKRQRAPTEHRQRAPNSTAFTLLDSVRFDSPSNVLLRYEPNVATDEGRG
jgi:DNA transposition AAA+ family ATPase